MPPRYDNRKKLLTLAVGDLTGPRLPGESRLGGGADRSELGRRAHVRIGERRASVHEDYEPERLVHERFRFTDGEVELGGRADGVWHEDGRWIVEEVKSVLPAARTGPAPTHVRQLQLYAWLLARELNAPVNARLTMVEVFTGEVTTHEVASDPGLDAWVPERLEAILRFHISEAARLEHRASLAQSIRFPFAHWRPGQEELATGCEKAVRTNRFLMVNAPTGSGKTAPLLVTALREAVRASGRLAFATSRTAQQADRMELIRHLGDPGAVGRVILLGSREALGLPAFGEDDSLDDPFDPVLPPPWFLEWLDGPEPVTPESVRELADERGISPALLQREAWRWSDVAVGDLNFFTHPDRHLPGWDAVGRTPRKTVLLLDEAHGLPERHQDRRAARLSPEGLRRAGENTAALDSSCAREARALLPELADHLTHLLEAPEAGAPLHELLDPAITELPELLPRATQAMACVPREPGFSGQGDVSESLRAADHATRRRELYECFLDRGHAGIAWELVQPGRELEEVWKRYSSVIAFSATLDPFEASRHELGLPVERTDMLELPDLTERDRRLVLRHVGIDTTWRGRGESLPDLAESLATATRSTGGPWLVFFPSRAYLENAASALLDQDVPVRVLLGGIPAPLLHRLLPSPRGPALLLAVMGGRVAEGFDPPAGAFDGLAVVSPSIPPMTPRGELLREAWEALEEDGLRMAYLRPALHRVRQAAGRLLRSGTQRGALLLVGRRFGRADILSLLPDAWREGEMVEDSGELAARLTVWWSGA